MPSDVSKFVDELLEHPGEWVTAADIIRRAQAEARAETLRQCARSLSEGDAFCEQLIARWSAEADTISNAGGGEQQQDTSGDQARSREMPSAGDVVVGDHAAPAPAREASRDESVPPPGWLPHPTHATCMRLGGVELPLARAWSIYDREHGYAPPQVDVAALSRDAESVGAALADACLAGGLSKEYYHSADAALRRIRASLGKAGT